MASMIVYRGKEPRLAIFESFITDNGLPKHAEELKEWREDLVATIEPLVRDGRQIGVNRAQTSARMSGQGRFTRSRNNEIDNQDLDIAGAMVDSPGIRLTAEQGRIGFFDFWRLFPIANSKRRKDGLISMFLKACQLKLAYWIATKAGKAKGVKPKPPAEVFNLVFHNDEQITNITQKINKFNDLIAKARTAGQVALEEKLHAIWATYLLEAILVENSFTRVMTEERLISFVMDSDRGLRLDWMKNFTRVIPDDVLARKLEADKLLVFDNYVVFHYDPDGKATEMTKEEKEAKKDPILFGVVEGSRKLYYIGDWIDEYCDLTWEKIAEKLGEKPDMKVSPEAVLKKAQKP